MVGELAFEVEPVAFVREDTVLDRRAQLGVVQRHRPPRRRHARQVPTPPTGIGRTTRPDKRTDRRTTGGKHAVGPVPHSSPMSGSPRPVPLPTGFLDSWTLIAGLGYAAETVTHSKAATIRAMSPPRNVNSWTVFAAGSVWSHIHDRNSTTPFRGPHSAW